mmetsp:Transcript_918/g.1803  ORF Transcript_918/g.1803 Transcript_918/m.1803 type:complete len:146 (+) Transcript_918:102-539(+)|eukprot:CAMPEP_0184536228 /NCGR_PEP_ID=MMETSP0198_2-20121128/16312_1 /TAXON_ID=1112570 /ORGANISM="Thraustochytrium sp., Strain LLF1b" /LENGTH=145 /DNA_ID=CAMNT_0026929325 /DNA_START=77 /DNA_END=514 /DNA_ORIENTATION=+
MAKRGRRVRPVREIEEAGRLRVGPDEIQVQTLSASAHNDMARPSVLLTLGANDFSERFSELFAEHVEGFTGLRGSKRPKSEKEKNMEWRVRLNEKRAKAKAGQPATNTSEVNGKKAASKAAKEKEKLRLAAIERYQKLKRAKARK